MNKQFIVGKYYRLRDDYPELDSLGEITFEGRKTDWNYIEKQKILQNRAGRLCQNVYIGSHPLLPSHVKFEGIKSDWGSGYKYFPEDFEEVPTTLEQCKLYKKEEKTMELKEIKQDNIAEAKKQFDNERANAEILFAKEQLRKAQDGIDEIDRKINKLLEEKLIHTAVIDVFNKKTKKTK